MVQKSFNEKLMFDLAQNICSARLQQWDMLYSKTPMNGPFWIDKPNKRVTMDDTPLIPEARIHADPVKCAALLFLDLCILSTIVFSIHPILQRSNLADFLIF